MLVEDGFSFDPRWREDEVYHEASWTAVCVLDTRADNDRVAVRAVLAQETPGRRTEGNIEWNYITPNAVVAAVAYPRRVLSAPEMEMMPIEIISAAANKELGIEPLDVDQLLLVVEPPAQGPPGVGVVVRFTKPYKLENLKLPAPLEFVDAELNGRPYRQPASPMGLGMYMPDDRTLIVATDAMLRGMLQEQTVARGWAVEPIGCEDDSVGGCDGPRRARTGPPSADGPVVADSDSAAVCRSQTIARPDRRRQGRIDGRGSVAIVAVAPGPFGAGGAGTRHAGQAAHADRPADDPGPDHRGDGKSDDPVEQASSAYAQRMTRRIFEMCQPQREGNMLVLAQEGAVANQTAVIGVLVALLLPAVQAAREAARACSPRTI